MRFESDYLDLETGNILQAEFLLPPPEGDFRFAYNSARANHIVLFQTFGVEIAFLDAVAFDTVNASHIATASFTTSLIDQPFDFDDTILVRTALGNVFKIGKPVENANFTVTFWIAGLQ